MKQFETTWNHMSRKGGLWQNHMELDPYQLTTHLIVSPSHFSPLTSLHLPLINI